MAAQSHQKSSSEAGSTVEVRRIRVKRELEPERKHRSRRRKSEDGRVQEKRRGRSEKAKQSTVRRSGDVRESSRRVIAKEADSTRKSRERRSSNHMYERTRHSQGQPLRSEKRSIPEAALKGSKERPIAMRSTSLRDQKLASTPRPSLFRSRTTSRKERPSTHAPPPTSYKPARQERAHSISGQSTTSEGRKRRSSIFGSVMSGSRTKEPEKQVECLTCLDEVPASKIAHLPCDHYMCNDCLKRAFDLSVTDPQTMPPKCCQRIIPIKHVANLYDSKFKKLWNQKNLEYRTKNRIYCVAKGCGTWIKPEEMKRDKQGRKYAKCSKCSTKVCCTCNGKYHSSAVCPEDPDTQAFVKTAKDNGWMTCYNCKATVELVAGCHHITCRCRAEFCILCGAKWKTCGCDQFDEQTMRHIRGIDEAGNRFMNIQFPHVGHIIAPPPFIAPRFPAMNPLPMPPAPPARDMRREQEARDEALARRLQFLDLDMGEDPDRIMQDQEQHWRNIGLTPQEITNLRTNWRHRLLHEPFVREFPARPHPHRAFEHLHRPPDANVNQPAAQRINIDGRGVNIEMNNPRGGAGFNIGIQTPPPPAPAAPHRRASTLGYQNDTERQRASDHDRRASQMAGIPRRGGTAEARVDEWRRWVDPHL